MRERGVFLHEGTLVTDGESLWALASSCLAGGRPLWLMENTQWVQRAGRDRVSTPRWLYLFVFSCNQAWLHKYMTVHLRICEKPPFLMVIVCWNPVSLSLNDTVARGRNIFSPLLMRQYDLFLLDQVFIFSKLYLAISSKQSIVKIKQWLTFIIGIKRGMSLKTNFLQLYWQSCIYVMCIFNIEQVTSAPVCLDLKAPTM